MLNLPSLLSTAAAAVHAARERASLPPAPITRQEEDAALERLPVVVREAVEASPEVISAPLLMMQTARDHALAERVAARLAEGGVEVVRTGGALHVSIPSLLAAAARYEAACAVQNVAALWRTVAGPSSSALADARSGTLTLSALGAAPNRRHVVAPGWADRPPAEVVEEARTALGLPAWTLPNLAAAWSDRAGPAATVAIEPGVFVGPRFFPAAALSEQGAAGTTTAALLFTLRPGVEAAAYAMTPATAEADIAALVERAARDLGVPARGAVPVPTGVRAEGRRSLRTPSAGLT